MDPRDGSGTGTGTGARRKSGLMSILHHEDVEMDLTSRVAAAPAIPAPTAPPPYSAPWPPPASTSSGLVSPPNSRRTSENVPLPPPPLQLQTTPLPRHSLPSIHEALSSSSSGPRTSAMPSPASASASQLFAGPPPAYAHPSAAPPSLPRPFGAAHGASDPTPFAPAAPLALPPTSPRGSFARGGPPRGPASPRAREELMPRAAWHHAPPRAEADPHRPLFAHHGAGPVDAEGPRLPPRGSDVAPPLFRHPQYTEQSAPPSANQTKVDVVAVTDSWDMSNALFRIQHESKRMYEWSSEYAARVQAQQAANKGAYDLMPTMDACVEMLRKHAEIRHYLEVVKTLVEHKDTMAPAPWRCDPGRSLGSGDVSEDEAGPYGDDPRGPMYPAQDPKKRKGRAAPPGRCHSCNRAETPEWRRGPDGARTLCNACGLHYAKLTRKNNSLAKQTQGAGASTMRPPSREDHGPRPV